MDDKQPSVERICGVTLRIGAYVAVVFLSVGFVLFLLEADERVLELRGPTPAAGDSLPLALIHFGMIALLLTPFAGVVATGIVFLERGEIRFSIVIAAVILILVVGFLTAS